jgi:hypothetical protein
MSGSSKWQLVIALCSFLSTTRNRSLNQADNPGQLGPISLRSDTGTLGLRPGRDDRPMLAVAERRARPRAERFDRPLRDGRVFFASFPSTSYWATFTESLRDKSSAYNPKPSS